MFGDFSVTGFVSDDEGMAFIALDGNMLVSDCGVLVVCVRDCVVTSQVGVHTGVDDSELVTQVVAVDVSLVVSQIKSKPVKELTSSYGPV